MDVTILLGVLGGLAILLALILGLRLPAFLSLLIASICTGLMTGIPSSQIMDTIKNGMGSTLGFVATVVGLGAIFGGILEKSGGAQAIAQFLLKKFGEKRASTAMVITGFVVAIPVFFDVAFIILIPVIYALQRKSGRSLLLYAIPLLAGLAITHAFIPPTPGPIAVAEIIGAELGWVILLGFIVGIPTAIVSGLLFTRYIAGKIHIVAPSIVSEEEAPESLPSMAMIFTIIGLPIILILSNTITGAGIFAVSDAFTALLAFIGHPFSALIIANILAWYLLGRRRGFSNQELTKISTKAIAPTGMIILLTGAGGTFKQVLVDSGAGKMIAEGLSGMGMPILIFAFLASATIRIVQGSATVAMITSAGMVAPLLVNNTLNGPDLALLTITIAAGASIFSHVNDSGFWLVKEYLGMTEKQTFKSWTVMTTVLALTGFVSALLINIVI